MTQRLHLPLAHDPRVATAPVPERTDGSPVRDAPVRESEEERLLQVGDLAKATGKTVRAIHHYEELGLLRPHARSKGRYRLYDDAALTRIRWIGKLHDLGLSLAQIQQIASLWEAAPSAPEA
ncbi:MAG TPA: MerR family transcriptional regulator, partial [Candidatus Nanopelagicales bacterium]|nr:MerR family transcriptional regulator [Candidatus Nanopelagicales bacterium]